MFRFCICNYCCNMSWMSESARCCLICIFFVTEVCLQLFLKLLNLSMLKICIPQILPTVNWCYPPDCLRGLPALFSCSSFLLCYDSVEYAMVVSVHLSVISQISTERAKRRIKRGGGNPSPMRPRRPPWTSTKAGLLIRNIKNEKSKIKK